MESLNNMNSIVLPSKLMLLVFKRFINHLPKIVFTVVLPFCHLVTMPSVAQADTTVPLDNSNDVVNVMTVYSTTPKTQAQVLSQVSQEEQAAFSKIPGFQDSAILKAQDGLQVTALSQWKGKELSSFQSYASEHTLNIGLDTKPQNNAKPSSTYRDENNIIQI